MASATFVYRDLESPTTIRLLKILQTVDKEHKETYCTLKHFPGDGTSRPEYDALSYHWGADPKAPLPKRIRVRYEEDQDFYNKRIQESLWDFMQASVKGTEAYYWVDALCLNQDSEPEKTQQVPRMGTIYSEASSTISWLGRGDGLDAIRKSSMNELPDWIKKNRQKVEELLGSLPADSFKLGDNTSMPDKLPKRDSEERNALCAMRIGKLDIAMRIIVNQTYWERVWIIQEVALAKKVEILFGSRSSDGAVAEESNETTSIDFDDFLVAYKVWVAYFKLNTIRPAAVEARMLMPSVSFEEILQWGATCKSSERLDMIYGLLGLLKCSEEASYVNSLDVDYKKTAAQLFWELVFGLRIYRQGRRHTWNSFPNNRARTRALCKSLLTGCILDGEGLREFATSCTLPKTHVNGKGVTPSCTTPEKHVRQALALVCMEAMPIYQAIGELLGWKFTRTFHNTEFGYREWVLLWGSKLPSYQGADSSSEISEDEILDVLKLGMEVYQDGDKPGTLAGGWRCLRGHDSNACTGCTNTTMLTELYIKSSDHDDFKRRMRGFYRGGNGDKPDREWQPDSQSLLVLEIKQMGWELRFQPAPELFGEGDWKPDATENTKIGKLFVHF